MHTLPHAPIIAVWLMAVEAAGLLIVLILAARNPDAGKRALRPLWRWLGRISRHQKTCVLAVGLLGGLSSVLVATVVRWPHPTVHDEFSYLLAADTFRQGRLTNATHAHWPHFESFHVLQHPSYASKYPPGQGLVLAAGDRLLGDPAAGIWLGTGLLCASICWMLYGWTRPRWALLGGLWCVLNFGFFCFWAQNFWGGAVAGIGGALLFGGLRRVIERPRAAATVAMTLGALVLANSRPFEGLVTAMAALAALGWWWISQRVRTVVILRSVLVPAAVLVVLGASWMGHYNRQITGDALRLPYQLYQEEYGVTPLFFLRPVQSDQPAFRHQPFTDFVEDNLGRYRQLRTAAGLFIIKTVEAQQLWSFFFRWAGVIAIFGLVYALRDPWIRYALVTVALLMGVGLLETFTMPRKAAPITALTVVLMMAGLRYLRLARPRSRGRRALLARSFAPICLASLLAGFLSFTWTPPFSLLCWRQGILAELEETPGDHLVMVRYAEDHRPDGEWVYNAADIDASRVVWARELGPGPDTELRSYFADRTVWILHADERPPRLERRGDDDGRQRNLGSP